MFTDIKASVEKLGVSKDTILDLIKNKNIDYVVENGEYKVDTNSIGIIHKFDGNNKLLSEFTEIFKDNTIFTMKDKFDRKPLESNTFWLNWNVMNNFNIYEIDDITLKLSQYFPTHSNHQFNRIINNTSIGKKVKSIKDLEDKGNSITFNDYENIIHYSAIELDGYIIIFQMGETDNLGYIIQNIFRTEDLKVSKYFTKKLFVKKYETLTSDYDVKEINHIFKDLRNIREMRLRYIDGGKHLEDGNFTKDELMEFIKISDEFFDELIDMDFIGNKDNDLFTFMDIEIIKIFVKNGVDETNSIFCKNNDDVLVIHSSQTLEMVS